MNKKIPLFLIGCAFVVVVALLLEDNPPKFKPKPQEPLLAKIHEYPSTDRVSKSFGKPLQFSKIKILCEDKIAIKFLEKRISLQPMIDPASKHSLEVTCYEEDDLMIFQLSYFENKNKTFENYFKQKKSSVDFSTEL